MGRLLKVLIVVLLGAVLLGLGLYWYVSTSEAREPSLVAYTQYCAGCHGRQLEGLDGGLSLAASPQTACGGY